MVVDGAIIVAILSSKDSREVFLNKVMKLAEETDFFISDNTCSQSLSVGIFIACTGECIDVDNFGQEIELAHSHSSCFEADVLVYLSDGKICHS